MRKQIWTCDNCGSEIDATHEPPWGWCTITEYNRDTGTAEWRDVCQNCASRLTIGGYNNG